MQETHSKIFFSKYNVNPLDDSTKPVIITDNFSTPENIGHIIRLAANVGALKVVVLRSENLRKSKIKKTAGTAIDHIPLVFSETDRLQEHIPEDYTFTALETAEGAKNIFNTSLPDKLALVLGNEKYGISDSLLKLCNLKVYIPMPGTVKSMNVTHAASVCLFEWLRQHS
jgi:tRNA G18 (ribose-2'-O)-methylase SpoU